MKRNPIGSLVVHQGQKFVSLGDVIWPSKDFHVIATLLAPASAPVAPGSPKLFDVKVLFSVEERKPVAEENKMEPL